MKKKLSLNKKDKKTRSDKEADKSANKPKDKRLDELRHKRFNELKDQYETDKIETYDDHKRWTSLLCQKLGSKAQVAERYDWHLTQITHQQPLQDYGSENTDMDSETLKETLSKANWDTYNAEYRTVACYLMGIFDGGEVRSLVLGCRNQWLLSVRIEINAFLLQDSKIVSEDPRIEEELGCDLL